MPGAPRGWLFAWVVACERRRARGSPPWAGRSGASTCGATGHGPPLPKSCEHCRSDGTVVRATIGRLAGILENPRRCWRIADVLGDAQGRSIWINSEGSAGGCLASYAIGTTFEGHEHGAAAQPAQSVVVTRESDPKQCRTGKSPPTLPRDCFNKLKGRGGLWARGRSSLSRQSLITNAFGWTRCFSTEGRDSASIRQE